MSRLRKLETGGFAHGIRGPEVAPGNGFAPHHRSIARSATNRIKATARKSRPARQRHACVRACVRAYTDVALCHSTLAHRDVTLVESPHGFNRFATDYTRLFLQRWVSIIHTHCKYMYKNAHGSLEEMIVSHEKRLDADKLDYLSPNLSHQFKEFESLKDSIVHKIYNYRLSILSVLKVLWQKQNLSNYLIPKGDN